MAVRGDEVAERIEQRIREAMEKVVADVRTSIEDVRVALHQQLDAAIQSVQADVKALAVRQHLEEGMREIETEYASEPVAPARVGVDSSRLKESIQNVEKGTNQVEILNALLEQCLAFGSRAALMILKGDTLAGWKGVGFTAHGGNDELIKRFSAPRDSVPQFEELLSEERVVAWNGDLSARFGVSPGERAILVPMVIKDKVAAAVYVDSVADNLASFDQHSIEMLVFTTGLLIDTQAHRKKIPSPTLSRNEAQPSESPATTTAPTPAPEQEAQEPQPQVEEAPTTPQPAPPPASGWGTPYDVSPEQTVAIRTSSLFRKPSEAQQPQEPATAPPPAASHPAAASEASPSAPSRSFQLDPDPAVTGVWSRPAREPEKPPVPEQRAEPAAEKPVAAERSPVASELAERPSTHYVPPPGLARTGPLSGHRDDDQKRHDDARRFARLLVSEIKLYNESQVDQGRRYRDLYERLKEDIDRSRQMYEERVADEIRKDTNYFYEELVRILADGNAESLGL